ncbi:MAG: VanZ family protein [Verrucomicrobia bacterium]|nr:VanZ family protein [Verrucomicrobiota bacterium]
MKPWIWPFLLAITIVLASGVNTTNPIDVNHSDKVVHFLVFGLIAIMVVRIQKPGTLIWALISFFVVSGFGALDEFRQSFTPGRSVEFADWLADTLGAGIAITSYKVLPWFSSFLEVNIPQKLDKKAAPQKNN